MTTPEKPPVDTSWMLEPTCGPTVPARPWDQPPVSRLPQLSRLLSAAQVTPVVLEGTHHRLLAWDLIDGRTSCWVLHLPMAVPMVRAPSVLHELWRVTGGIADLWGRTEDTWLCNHDAALTPALAARSPAEQLAAYSWIWEQDGLTVPIDPADYGVLAEEGNGNLTLFHRTTGEVLLFAPDHDFGHVEVLEGCPEYSLYRIPSAPDVTAWVETVAGQWLAAVRG
jgi:hypothetical protein